MTLKETDKQDAYDNLSLHLSRLKSIVFLVRSMLESPHDQDAAIKCASALWVAEEEIEAAELFADYLYGAV